MKDSFSLLLAYLKPIKGHGTIGMLQRTIVYSEWVLVISFVISIILQCFNNNDGWIQFFENYAIGIACSVVIVIVMTIIQFVSARNEVYEAYYYNLFHILVNLDFALSFKRKEDYESLTLYVDELEKLLQENQKLSNKLFWFNIKKNHQSGIVNTFSMRLWIMQKREFDNHELNISEDFFKNYKTEIITLIILIDKDDDIRLFKIFQDESDEGENNDQL